MKFNFELPPELIAELKTEIVVDVLDQLDHRQAEQWPEWMRLPTAARYIDVSEHALRKRAERGEITYSQEGPGCAVWFARSDLDAFMLDQRHEARSSR